MAEPLTEVREISKLAYSFIASKALFAALNLELFGHISKGTTTPKALAEATKVPLHRIETLVAALLSTGIIVRKGGVLANAPATARYLVPGEPAYFGDYYRFQIGGQIYANMLNLDAGLRGDEAALVHKHMSGWLSDPQRAEDFSRAQHAGSLGPAIMMAKRLNLSGMRQLLDVAGGTGAFSIALCQRHPTLSAAILDFPAVIDVARRYVAQAGMAARIALIAGDAREIEWPKEQDAVLMSYLLSAVNGADIGPLLARAHAALRPGGMLLVHDFMLDEEREGPSSAALFFLSYLAVQPDAISFATGELRQAVEARGFVKITSEAMIPEITTLLIARKPG